ncbi:MAG: hypothetical protein AAF552_06480 [Pseudomonadota bacterium]
MSVRTTALLFAALLTSFSAAAQLRETGADDFRITNFGPADDTFAFAARQTMVYNPQNDEFYVVFLGRRPEAPVASDEIEMYGLRLDRLGSPIGDPVLLTSVDGIGAAGDSPQERRLAYDPNRNGYVVVYSAQDSEFGSSSVDIYGRLIGANGQPVGPAFVVDDNATGDFRPDIAFNSQDGEFLVVWTRVVDGVFNRTIQARRFDAVDGAPIGEVFRVDSIDGFKTNPTVVYNNVDNEYLVAWANNTEAPRFRILSADGTPQITPERAYATPGFFTARSEIVFNPDLGEYLIVFGHSDPAEGVVQESYEMFGRRIDSAGNALGAGKFRISFSAFVDSFTRAGANVDCQPGGQCLETARPGVFYSSGERAYFVAWSGNLRVQNDPDREVFLRVLRAGADPAPGADQLQISNMGSDNINFLGLLPNVAASSAGLLVTWWGDDNANGGIDNKFELWGQRLLPQLFADGFEVTSN